MFKLSLSFASCKVGLLAQKGGVRTLSYTQTPNIEHKTVLLFQVRGCSLSGQRILTLATTDNPACQLVRIPKFPFNINEKVKQNWGILSNTLLKGPCDRFAGRSSKCSCALASKLSEHFQDKAKSLPMTEHVWAIPWLKYKCTLRTEANVSFSLPWTSATHNQAANANRPS